MNKRKEIRKGLGLEKYKQIGIRWHVLCDMSANPETHWWINDYLKAYPPEIGLGK